MEDAPPDREPPASRRLPLLFLSIFVIAACGIVYELIIATVSSYLLGDSVLQFSLTIGLYMSAMGLGAYLTQWFRRDLFAWFVAAELLVSVVGGGSALFLFAVYAETSYYEPAMYLATIAIGVLVGLEIPLLMRLLAPEEDARPLTPTLELRTNVSFVLSADYVGGLLGAVAFPLVLLPHVGLIRTAALIGLGNVAVAGLSLWQWGRGTPRRPALVAGTVVSAGLLAAILWQALPLERYLEQRLYRDRVVMSTQTPYQHLTLTQTGRDTRLFINGALQFSSIDEYRYHEALVHVPLGFVPRARDVLILGGGDGLAAREVLRRPGVRRLVLVDLDPAMTELARRDARLRELNGGSLDDPRLQVVNQDAYKYVEQAGERFDALIVDLPDPENTAIVKLYSLEFYRLAGLRLRPHGVMVVQSTSPFFARAAFWCIHKTLAAAGFNAYAYHLDVPSFGEWGFNLAARRPLHPGQFRPPGVPTRFLTPEVVPAMFRFGADEDHDQEEELEVNTLLSPVILRYYRQGWDRIRD